MKKMLPTLILVFFSTLIFANPVTKDQAKSAAISYFIKYSEGTTDYTVRDFSETKYAGLTTYYTFNFNSGGWVMVAADDAVTPILGFSPTGSFDPTNLPDNEKYFLGEYQKEIKVIVDSKMDNTETSAKWADVINSNFPKGMMMAVSPMCATLWDQPSPYNNLCPSGAPTGCVATTMAQIMKKWNYPTTGVGSHSYTHATYGVQTANFGSTTYQWATMTNTYSGASSAAAKAAVATLMYHCGVSVDMNYGPTESGAYSTAIPPALINYFSYQQGCEVKSRSLYATDILWQQMIRAEMDQGRPCTLAGSDATAGGHEWVCDGYNPSILFHMNWGWGGSSNAYFSLTNLNPGSFAFNNNREAVIRIHPFSAIIPIANFTASNTIPAIGAPVNFTDASVNSPTSWLWTFDGGTPATSTLQNPTGITFATNGYHLVSLTATNVNGSDIKTKERYIKVGGAPTVWTKQNSGFAASSRGIDEIDIIDANTVWAKAYDGSNPTGYIREFTRTNNGGATWTPGTITFTGSTNYGVSNLYSVNYLTAYACMFPVTGTGGAIVKTTDGGTTWAIQPGATFVNSWANFVHFFDANNGVCMGDPTATTGTDFFIYTTSNGGASWTQVPGGSIPNCLSGETGITNEYSVVGNTCWFTTTKGRIYKSTNMGLTWTVTTTGLTHSYEQHFKDANVGIIVEDTIPYTMRKTIDGGATWSTLAPTGYLVKRPRLAFVPGSISTWYDVAAFPSNGSSRSDNECASFVNVDTGSVQFLSVSFLDAYTGWAGSFNVSPTNDGIYKWNPATTTGVDNSSSVDLSGIVMYPNPTKDVLNFQLGKIDDENMTITIYNMLGAKVMTQKIRTISNDLIQVDISNNDAGIYFVNIVNGGKSVTKKITIVK